MHHYLEPLPYPHIPVNTQDREENSDPETWQKCPVWKLIESSLFPLLLFGDFANGCCLKRQNPQHGEMTL